MNQTIVINGRFLAQRTSGVQRVAREVVRTLDRLAGDGALDDLAGRRLELLTPPNAPAGGFELDHIERRVVGRLRGHPWEQLDLARAARGATLLSLGNTGPLRMAAQVVFMHDAAVFTVPEAFTAPFRTWYRFALRRLGRRCAVVVTPSDFSSRELAGTADIPRSKLVVAPLGREHILAAPADPSVLERHDLQPGRYVLAVASTAPHKNLGALVRPAAALRERGFPLALVGVDAPRVFAGAEPDLAGVRRIPECTDAELRALYESARCLAFPSLYEGFGLPPLEAMTCGCPVLAGEVASLREVCGDAAHYCDPADWDDVYDRLLELVGDTGRRDELTRRGHARAAGFSWERTAQIVWDALRRASS